MKKAAFIILVGILVAFAITPAFAVDQKFEISIKSDNVLEVSFGGNVVGEISSVYFIPRVLMNMKSLEMFVAEKAAMDFLKEVSVDGLGFNLMTMSVRIPGAEICYDSADKNLEIVSFRGGVRLTSGNDMILIDKRGNYRIL